jgi:hypothetical protein
VGWRGPPSAGAAFTVKHRCVARQADRRDFAKQRENPRHARCSQSPLLGSPMYPPGMPSGGGVEVIEERLGIGPLEPTAPRSATRTGPLCTHEMSRDESQLVTVDLGTRISLRVLRLDLRYSMVTVHGSRPGENRWSAQTAIPPMQPATPPCQEQVPAGVWITCLLDGGTYPPPPPL